MSIYKGGQTEVSVLLDGIRCNLLYVLEQGCMIYIGCISNNMRDRYINMGWDTNLYTRAGITYLKFNQKDSQSLIEEGKYYKIYIGDNIIYTTKSFGEWFYKELLAIKNKPENTGVFSVGGKKFTIYN